MKTEIDGNRAQKKRKSYKDKGGDPERERQTVREEERKKIEVNTTFYFLVGKAQGILG